MAVGQQLGGVGIVELIGAIAHDAVLPILPHDSIVATPHFDDPLIPLVGDEHISVRQVRVLHRRVELVGSEPGDAELAILPNNVAAAIDEDNTVIAAATLFGRDRKSTRLNSSHQIISYAVFCLKKKKNKSNARCYETTSYTTR